MTLDPTAQNSGQPSGPLSTQPGEIKVIKRTGQVVPYDESKIFNAIFSAYLDIEGESIRNSTSVHDKVRILTERASQAFHQRLPSGGALPIEEVQDQVELELFRAAEHRVAREYVLFREQHARQRLQQKPEQPKVHLRIQEADGGTTLLQQDTLAPIIERAAGDLEGVNVELILQTATNSLFDGISRKEVNEALIFAARALVNQEPNYSFVAARLLNFSIHNEVMQTLGLLATGESVISAESEEMDMPPYPELLAAYLDRGIQLGYLDPELRNFDLQAMGEMLEAERDQQFSYLGLQTLYDRYLLHDNNKRYELPQLFFLRIAMGLSLREPRRNERAREYYRLISSFDYMPSTPTLFNAGTTRSQLSSCYLTTVPDDLSGIFQAIHENAMLSKWAGGLGNDWTQVRAMGSHIQGTNGESQGVVPFLKLVDTTAVAVNQGGKRKGAVCCYLESWHLDIEEFLELRKNTGDERRRTPDMHTANWIPDLFMKRVEQGGQWTLFSPADVPDLHDLTGRAFEHRYEEYEKQAAEGSLKPSKQLDAVKLWRSMLNMLFETGHPWITFKDACNLRSPQQHSGTVHSSNLCTEITLNTSEQETAVCNLGSINLANHIAEGKLDIEHLQQTVKTAIRMLDNVIDINYYAVDKARNSNLRHRPVGLGIMGFQDALYEMKIPYASDTAVEFADRSMEQISYAAITASSDLAVERGRYESYPGSLWSQGILPIDSIALLGKERGEEYLQLDTSTTLDWGTLRKKVRKQGMRNSHVMAIAPTATIANIVGVTASIEPTYQHLFSKSNLSGDFTVINAHLVRVLKELDLWDDALRADLAYYDGSVQKIERLPAEVRELFATAFEVKPRWLVEAAARRQKWIDQAQSLNLYIDKPSGKNLDLVYRQCWYRGLKTTYYLRSRGATAVEKTSSTPGVLNAVSVAPPPLSCDLSDPDCEACQ